ncbi:MAG: hypothetical protein ACJA0N_000017 [Pseudohongiellaceae bacterium]|jgi:uncharacterized protein (TIGR02001 family)
MKIMKSILAVTLAASAISSATFTMAEGSVSANIGFASEYYYCGILQTDSSASAGLDYENGGFSLGTWVSDVGDGLEVDVYGSYTVEVGEVALSAGVTGYYYTGDTFDDTYEEVNLGAAWGH